MSISPGIRLLRFLVLLAGTACAALILTLGLTSWSYTAGLPLLRVQCLFLFVVSGLSLVGISTSAFFSGRLRASRTLRRLFVVPAALFPLNDFFPVLAGGTLDLHLVPALVMSGTVGAVIALAVASSWLPTFLGVSENADG